MLFGWPMDEEKDRILTYLLFAEAWGWTPRQVDELYYDEVIKLAYLLKELNKEKMRMSRKERKELGI